MAFDERTVIAVPAERSELDRERSLVEQAQRGDLEALRPIFDRYAPQLYATIALPRMGDSAAAEDVVREALGTAVQKLHKFRWQGRGIYPWLRQITVNKAYDALRKNRRNHALATAFADEQPVESAREDRADHRLIAEQDRAANRQRIDDAMSRLNDRYRRAIEMRLLDERSRDECAAELAITVGNFDVLFHRAVRAFRKHFGERE